MKLLPCLLLFFFSTIEQWGGEIRKCAAAWVVVPPLLPTTTPSHRLFTTVGSARTTTATCNNMKSSFLSSTAQEDVDEEMVVDEEALDQKLWDIAHCLRLEVYDLDEGIYGFDTRDSRYGLEVIHADVKLQGDDASLGLILTEVAGSNDGRGLVLVRHVSDSAATAATAPIQVGDVITGVRTSDGTVVERVTGFNYDRTVAAIQRVKSEIREDGIMSLELNRLVPRATVTVHVNDENGNHVETIPALAGENLRRLLLRRGLKMYDGKTKRYDMPFSTGDCAGDGLCGTCLVAVTEGMEHLNPIDEYHGEKLLLKGRPLSWRASCRTVVGADNKPGTIHLQLRPQSCFEEERDPGVRPV